MTWGLQFTNKIVETQSQFALSILFYYLAKVKISTPSLVTAIVCSN